METGDRSPVGVPDNVEVAEEASWAVTPTQRFESAPHPEGMAEKTCGGLQPRRHRCDSCCPLQLTGGSSGWSEFLPWKQGAVGSNPTLQTNSGCCFAFCGATPMGKRKQVHTEARSAARRTQCARRASVASQSSLSDH